MSAEPPGAPAALRARDVMSTWLVAVDADDDACTAWEAMGGAGVHHLPVLDAGHLLAVLTERDLAVGHPGWSPTPRRRTVRELVSRAPVQVRPDHTLQHVARCMASGDTDVVVVAGPTGDLMGMITTRDLVDALAGHVRQRRGTPGEGAGSGPATPPVVLRVAHRPLPTG